MKEAPFKFGEVVTGSHFTNREEEIGKLHSNFRSLQNTIIISPRRYGKSSLVKEAAARFAEEEHRYIFCFLDLMYVYSEEEFYNRFATTLLKAAAGRVEEILQLAKSLISGARIGINTGTGEPAVEFGVSFIRENLDTILNLPQSLARRKRKKIIVCIDEFQNIARFDDDYRLQGRLRSVWQHHDRAGYIMYGSKQTMMSDLFSKTNAPFYKFGEMVYLSRIAAEKLKDYIQGAFRSTGKEISDPIALRIIETVENHPYYLQQFARNIWLVSGKKVSEADFDKALDALRSENQNFYNEILDDLTSYQVGYLRALLNRESRLYATETIYRYRLGSSANVRRMFKSFLQKGIITKENNQIIFTDPIFRMIAAERLM